MNKPVKHHYIPQSILRRFCDADGQLYTFNKEVGKHGRKKYPAAVCYVEHLHTLINGDDKFTEIEALYSTIEDQLIEFLKEIDGRLNANIKIDSLKDDPNINRIISLFLSLSFWRIPKRSGLAGKARKKLRKIYDAAPNDNKELVGLDRSFIRDLERKSASVSTKISQFVVLPALLSNASNSAVRDCWFYPTQFDQAISDDPIVCDMNEDFMLAGDIYLPVGSRLCITNAPQKIPALQEKMVNNASKIVMANSKECLSVLCELKKETRYSSSESSA